MESKKDYFKKMTICLVLLVVIWGGYVIASARINDKNLQDAVCEVDYSVLAEIENIEYSGEMVTMSGWALRKDSMNVSIHVLLDSKGADDDLFVKAQSSEREDIETYFLGENIAGECGFNISINGEKLKSDKCYEVLLVLEYKEKEANTDKYRRKEKVKIALGRYLFDGQLYTYNPERYIKPLVNSEELENVVENGTLRAFLSDEQIWIYQFDSKLYYFVDSQINSLEKREGGLRIPVMPRTSRDYLLPSNRIKDGYDHLGAFSKNLDYGADEAGGYHVVVVDLPTEYPVTYIMTGIYDDAALGWKKRIDIMLTDWRKCEIK